MRKEKVKKAAGVTMAIIMTCANAVCAYAAPIVATADPNEILAPINNLKTLVLAIIAVAGVIVAAIGVSQLSAAIAQGDSPSLKQAIMMIAGGVLMAAVGGILTFLGLG